MDVYKVFLFSSGGCETANANRTERARSLAASAGWRRTQRTPANRERVAASLFGCH
jgi:hypothetical protein